QQGTVRAGVLLGLLALAVVGCSGKSEPEKNEQLGVKDEQSAVKMVEKLGGKVMRDDKRPGKPVVAVDLYETKVTDAGLKELKELKNLRTLNLGGTGITDAGLKKLKEFKSLQGLNLMDTKVTDAGVKELMAALPELQVFR
ncbi:MAG TPA: hypothetical protein VKD72_17355, partial [Gemmataceae bacterium]|nr:hypothetical protein [Gemmataceae bacterium]